MEMNKFSLSLRLTLLMLLCLGFSLVAEPKLNPEHEGHIDLGVTREGQLKRGSFSVTNSGDSQLAIGNFLVTCTCLEITNSPSGNLSPGESAEFNFIFDTTGLGGKEAKKEVIISSNDPNSPCRVTISTRVKSKASYHKDTEVFLDDFSLVVDVRSSEKFADGHVLGAKNVPQKDFASWARSLPGGVTVYLYSQEGKVSDKLASDLDSSVQAELISLVGGYVQWELKHDQYLVRRGG